MGPVSKEDLEGPTVDRRTVLKLASASGATGLTAALAGCSGQTETEDDENGTASGGGETDTGDTTATTAEPPAEEQFGGQVEIALLTDQITHLHPYRASHGESRSIVNNLRNSLVRFNQDSEIVGDIATDWTLPDESTYVFTLRDDVTFHNGDSMTAADIKFSIEYLQNMESSPVQSKVSNVESVTAPDDTTLRVNLSEPVAPFLTFCTRTGAVGSTISETAIQELGEDQYDRTPVSTGAFELTERETGNYLLLERNDDYHETDENGNALPYLDSVRVNLIPEPTTAWTALNTDAVKYVNRLPPELAEQASNQSRLGVVGANAAEWYSICPLCADPAEHPDWAAIAGDGDPTQQWQGTDVPTFDPRVRKAISLAIDRERLVEIAYRGWARPAHTLWNPAISWMHEEEPDPGQYYDPERARELLDEAGYTGDPRFTLDMVGLPEREREMTVLQQQLGQVGIEANPVINQPSEYWPRIYDFTDQLAMYSGSNDTDPWDSWYKQLHTPMERDGTQLGIWNRGLYSNEAVDQALEQSSETPDRDERKAIIEEGMQHFFEETPHVMTVYPQTPRASANELKNVGIQLGLSNFQNAFLEE
jgi:peptide/nickel transport system substrate-binding protein